MILQDSTKTIAVYHAPKLASRTVISWLVLADNLDLINQHPDWFAESRHKTTGEYKDIRSRVSVFDKTHDWGGKPVPMSPHPIRVCITGDPIKRFVSGFVNRAVYHNGYAGTIKDFIRDFDKLCEESVDFRVHFRPQWWFYGNNPNMFTHRIAINNLNRLRELIETVRGVSLPDMHLQQSGTTATPELDEKDEFWIRRRFAVDFELYWRKRN